MVTSVGCRVLGITVDSQRALELGNIHLLAVGARLDEDDLFARGRSRESSNGLRDYRIESVGELACPKRRCDLLVVYFCPLPTTSAPDGALVRLRARVAVAKVMRALKTFMLAMVNAAACLGLEKIPEGAALINIEMKA